MADAKTFAVGEVLSAADVNEYLNGGYWKRIDRFNNTSGSPVTSRSFPSLSSDFRLFRLTFSVSVAAGTIYIRMNNDSGNNYNTQRNSAIGATTNSDHLASQPEIQLISLSGPMLLVGEVIISKLSSGIRGMFHAHMAAYAAAFTPDEAWGNANGSWNNTSALINRIDFLGSSSNFYGTVALEGMHGV